MNTRELLNISPVIPVMVIDDLDSAVDLAQALVAGGIRVLEITLRSPVALAAIRRIRDQVPAAVVGAGTLTRPEHVQAAKDAGAVFGVSPGLTPALAQAVQASGLPLLPGVATASELMAAQAAGFDTFKLFPAQAVGGVALLQALHGPFAEARFCPTGGINPDNAPAYLSLPNVLAVGGSWLTPKAVVAAHDWAQITALAQAAARLKNTP